MKLYFFVIKSIIFAFNKISIDLDFFINYIFFKCFVYKYNLKIIECVISFSEDLYMQSFL